MTYKFISIDKAENKAYQWGRFNHNKEKMFLFTSYLLGVNNPEDFYIIEEETNKAVSLISFAQHNNITKDYIKNNPWKD
jgi:hypothetical protein